MSFQNCQVLGISVDCRAYHARNKGQRGQPDFIMSPSSLNAFARGPSRWVRGWSPPQTKSQEWGNLVDCRTLTPELFESRYEIEPETYPEGGMECPVCKSITDSKKCAKCKTERVPVITQKAWRYGADYTDKWEADVVKSGREAISTKLVSQCDAAVKRLFEVVGGDDAVQRWFDASDRQVQLAGEWLDEATGLVVPVSALLDFVPRLDTEFAKSIGDFKSSKSAQHIKFQRQAFEWGYHVQAAFDMDLYKAATGEDRNTWCFIIQENFEPWEPNRAIYGQEQDQGQPGFIEIGREAQWGGYERMLANYCQCLKSGRWPGYNQTDESVQGWCVLRPEPFVAERCAYAPQYAFGEEPEESEVEENQDEVPIP